VPLLNELKERYSEKVDFLVVYIREAHSSDEWPVGRTVSCVKQPQTLEERRDNALLLFGPKFLLKVELVLDSIQNSFNELFCGWPIRQFIIQNNKLLWKSQPNIQSLSLELEEFQRIVDHCYENENI